MTNCLNDFLHPPEDASVRIRTVSVSLNTIKRGTIVCSIKDDDGVVHQIQVPDTCYSPQLSRHLLSPQHLAQVNAHTDLTDDGAVCLTTGCRVTLECCERQFTRSEHLNVAVIRSAPSYKTYISFDADYGSSSREPFCFPAHLIPPDEDDGDAVYPGSEPPCTSHPPASSTTGSEPRALPIPLQLPPGPSLHPPGISRTRSTQTTPDNVAHDQYTPNCGTFDAAEEKATEQDEGIPVVEERKITSAND